jgi:hypothetical protein
MEEDDEEEDPVSNELCLARMNALEWKIRALLAMGVITILLELLRGH